MQRRHGVFDRFVSASYPPETLLDGLHRKLPHIYKMTSDRCRGGHDRADQVRAAVFALAAFEIAVRRASAALMRRQYVSVHADAHAAACVAPLETGRRENFVQAFLLGFRFDAA